MGSTERPETYCKRVESTCFKTKVNDLALRSLLSQYMFFEILRIADSVFGDICLIYIWESCQYLKQENGESVEDLEGFLFCENCGSDLKKKSFFSFFVKLTRTHFSLAGCVRIKCAKLVRSPLQCSFPNSTRKLICCKVSKSKLFHESAPKHCLWYTSGPWST